MVASGTQLIAPASGKVEADWLESGGKCGSKIKIKHDGIFISPYTGEEVKLVTRYCHLSEITVTDGKKVSTGDILGKTGGAASKVNGTRDDRNKDGVIVDADNAARTSSDYYREAGAGNSTQHHLHYEVYEDGKYVSPKIYVRGGGDYDYVPCEAIVSDIITIDDVEPIDNDVEPIDNDVEPIDNNKENKPDCYGVLSTKEVRLDTFKLMKIYTNGFIIDDNGAVVHETKFFPNTIGYTPDVNAKGVERYAKQNGLTDDGDDISIINGNIWVDCRLNSVIFNHINDNDITYG